MAKNTMLQKAVPHIGALLLFLIIPILYFLPQVQGKVIPTGDLISAIAMNKELQDYKKAHGGVRAWWTNAMFGGMPAYQIDSAQPNNFLHHVGKINELYIPRPIGYFFALCTTFYLLLIYLGVSPWMSVIAALCFSFSTGNLTLYEAGHMAKFRVIAFFGMMFLGMLMVFKKDLLRGGILFALGLGVSLYGNHVQMIYYFLIALGLYVLMEMVRLIREGELAFLAKALGVLVLATGIALGSSASKLWTTYEYSKDTMRGDPILSNEATVAGSKTSSETNGLDWQYAMNWSNGSLDVFASMIPGFVGGGSAEKVGTDSEVYKDLRKKGANLGADFKAPLYWGSLPSTSGPFYFGAIICFLFLLGAITVKGPLKWWLVVATVFLFLMSMGKNFAILNHLLFDYFPLFNKFRTPNSVLTVTGFFLPILGALSVSQILEGTISKAEIIKGLKISTAIAGGICLLSALLGPSMFSFSSPGDVRLEQAGYSLQAIYADRQSLLRSDSLRSLILILLAAGLLWGFVEEKIKSSMMLAALGILAIGDLWIVDKRYVSDSNFVSKSKYETNFNPRPVDTQILADKDPNYRVLDLSINTFNDASSSYFHKTIGGYHAAKLQRYQDLVERHISRGNQAVLGMLNTRYVISKDQEAQRFPNSLGNAWLVKQLQTVANANEEIDALSDFNPADVAIVNQEFSSYINGLNPTGSGTISLTDYEPIHLTYESNTNAEEFAVFSEIWYGPDKGWEAFIDGNPVEHIRVNYLLRALKIPAGTHKIEFKFIPQKFYTGEKITLVCSILIILGSLWVFAQWFAQWFQQNQNMSVQTEKVAPKKTAKPLKKTKSKKGKNKK